MGIKGTPNFNEPAPIQPGLYKCKITGVEQKTGKQSGAPYLNWKFVTEDGQWVFFMTSWSGKGALKFKDLVRAAAFPQYEGGEIDCDRLLGYFVMAKIEPNILPDGTVSKYPQVTEVHACGDSFDSFEGDLP